VIGWVYCRDSAKVVWFKAECRLLQHSLNQHSLNRSRNVCCLRCRGRVMNRAARIADKAGSGQVWCSEASWLQYESLPGSKQNVDCQPLGPFVLKVRGLGKSPAVCALPRECGMEISSCARSDHAFCERS
jgi:hypothetical protein